MAQPPVQTGGLLSRHGAENAQCYAHNVKSNALGSNSYNLEQKASLENRSYVLDLKIKISL